MPFLGVVRRVLRVGRERAFPMLRDGPIFAVHDAGQVRRGRWRRVRLRRAGFRPEPQGMCPGHSPPTPAEPLHAKRSEGCVVVAIVRYVQSIRSMAQNVHIERLTVSPVGTLGSVVLPSRWGLVNDAQDGSRSDEWSSLALPRPYLRHRRRPQSL